MKLFLILLLLSGCHQVSKSSLQDKSDGEAFAKTLAEAIGTRIYKFNADDFKANGLTVENVIEKAKEVGLTSPALRLGAGKNQNNPENLLHDEKSGSLITQLWLSDTTSTTDMMFRLYVRNSKVKDGEAASSWMGNLFLNPKILVENTAAAKSYFEKVQKLIVLIRQTQLDLIAIGKGENIHIDAELTLQKAGKLEKDFPALERQMNSFKQILTDTNMQFQFPVLTTDYGITINYDYNKSADDEPYQYRKNSFRFFLPTPIEPMEIFQQHQRRSTAFQNAIAKVANLPIKLDAHISQIDEKFYEPIADRFAQLMPYLDQEVISNFMIHPKSNWYSRKVFFLSKDDFLNKKLTDVVAMTSISAVLFSKNAQSGKYNLGFYTNIAGSWGPGIVMDFRVCKDTKQKQCAKSDPEFGRIFTNLTKPDGTMQVTEKEFTIPPEGLELLVTSNDPIAEKKNEPKASTSRKIKIYR